LCAGSVAWAAAPANDRFANRIALTGTNIVVTGTNVGANKEGAEPDHAGNRGGNSVWWSWIAPANGDVTITTDGSTNDLEGPLDTLLAVYTGSALSTLSVVASNDDHSVLVTSRVRFQAIQNVQYQIAVDGFNDGGGGTSGNIMLTLAFASEPIVRPPNDNFANRAALVGSSVATNASNTNATRQPGEPVHAGKLGDTSVWWTWTAPTGITVRISTEGSGLDTLLAAYSGTSLSNLTEVASSDDIDPAEGILTSALILQAAAGQTFQIAVDGFDGASGPIRLRLDPVAASLSAPRTLADRRFQFTVAGALGKAYNIEVTENFSGWSLAGTITNTNASVIFIDPLAGQRAKGFYRAVLVPELP
jgi:hypothetical protein